MKKSGCVRSLGSNNANDLSGNGYNGTLQGNAAVVSAAGAGGTHAFDLPAHGDYVQTSYGFSGATQRAVSLGSTAMGITVRTVSIPMMQRRLGCI